MKYVTGKREEPASGTDRLSRSYPPAQFNPILSLTRPSLSEPHLHLRGTLVTHAYNINEPCTGNYRPTLNNVHLLPTSERCTVGHLRFHMMQPRRVCIQNTPLTQHEPPSLHHPTHSISWAWPSVVIAKAALPGLKMRIAIATSMLGSTMSSR